MLDNVFIISPNAILVVLNNLLTGCSQHKPLKISLQVYKFKMGVISGTYFWEQNLKAFLQLIMRGSISSLSPGDEDISNLKSLSKCPADCLKRQKRSFRGWKYLLEECKPLNAIWALHMIDLMDNDRDPDANDAMKTIFLAHFHCLSHLYHMFLEPI